MHDRFRTPALHTPLTTILSLLCILALLALSISEGVRSGDFSYPVYLLLNIPAFVISFFLPRHVYRHFLRQIPASCLKSQTPADNRKVRIRPLLYAGFTLLILLFIFWLLSLVTPIRSLSCFGGGLFLFLRVLRGLNRNDWSYLDGTWKKKISPEDLEPFDSFDD